MDYTGLRDKYSSRRLRTTESPGVLPTQLFLVKMITRVHAQHCMANARGKEHLCMLLFITLKPLPTLDYNGYYFTF